MMRNVHMRFLSLAALASMTTGACNSGVAPLSAPDSGVDAVATGGVSGTPTAGAGGTSAAGVSGTATAGVGGISAAGVSGTAIAGAGGLAIAGAGGGAGSMAPSSGAAGSIPPGPSMDCPCAPGGGFQVLTCGSPWALNVGRDAPDAVVTPDGNTVAMNRCAKNARGTCDHAVYRWTSATGTTKLADEGWVFALSDDGNTVLAERSLAGANSTRLFLWKSGTNVELPFGAAANHLLSADGNTVVSRAASDMAARWTVAGGLESLGDLPGGAQYSDATAMTADASIVVGYGNTPAGQEPFLWTATTARMVDLLMAAPQGVQTVAEAVSADGNTIVGTRLDEGGTLFRWTASGGIVGLADSYRGLPGPSSFFLIWQPPLLLSKSGAVVSGSMVGVTASAALSPAAFRWTPGAGIVALTPHQPSIVRGASADGKRILGSRLQQSATGASPFSIGHQPFVWDEASGARDLGRLLEQGGARLTGVVLGDPIALSADGTTVVGHATCGASEIIFRAKLAD